MAFCSKVLALALVASVQGQFMLKTRYAFAGGVCSGTIVEQDALTVAQMLDRLKADDGVCHDPPHEMLGAGQSMKFSSSAGSFMVYPSSTDCSGTGSEMVGQCKNSEDSNGNEVLSTTTFADSMPAGARDMTCQTSSMERSASDSADGGHTCMSTCTSAADTCSDGKAQTSGCGSSCGTSLADALLVSKFGCSCRLLSVEDTSTALDRTAASSAPTAKCQQEYDNEFMGGAFHYTQYLCSNGELTIDIFSDRQCTTRLEGATSGTYATPYTRPTTEGPYGGTTFQCDDQCPSGKVMKSGGKEGSGLCKGGVVCDSCTSGGLCASCSGDCLLKGNLPFPCSGACMENNACFAKTEGGVIVTDAMCTDNGAQWCPTVPTPPPTPPPAVAPTVVVPMTVQGIEYQQLMDDAAAKIAFEIAIKTTIWTFLATSDASSAGVTINDVTLILSAGSVKVEATVPVADPRMLERVGSSLRAAQSTTMGAAVAAALNSMPSITAIATGTITATVSAPYSPGSPEANAAFNFPTVAQRALLIVAALATCVCI